MDRFIAEYEDTLIMTEGSPVYQLWVVRDTQWRDDEGMPRVFAYTDEYIDARNLAFMMNEYQKILRDKIKEEE